MRSLRLFHIALVVAASAAALSTCNDVPVTNLTRSFTVQVLDQQDNRDPAKIDFLWVIDNSSSMCEEQAALARNFSQFVTTLKDFIVNMDVRMAVVKTNVLLDHSAFNRETATAFPPPCRRQAIKKCLKDEDCERSTSDSPALAAPPGASRWLCTWANKNASYLVNENQSINSRCMLVCDSDESCQSSFGQEFECREYDANITDPGCMIPPPACPPVPPILEGDEKRDNFDLFGCIATVGADPSFSANLEQGLAAARYALDPFGPNRPQVEAFLRPDAWLVLIFVSDEDDCSLTRECLLAPDGVTWNSEQFIRDNCISRDQYNSCALLGDATVGGPLAPVSRFVNAFKSLKEDPSKVLVAAIVGDSQKVDAQEREADIAAYRSSEQAPTPYATNTYICSSNNGVADYGSRYIDLVRSFGGNGVLANICGPAPCTAEGGGAGYQAQDGTCRPLQPGQELATLGISSALDLISETIVRRVVRICLPRPVRCLIEDPTRPGICLQSTGIEVRKVNAQKEQTPIEEAPPEAFAPGPGQFRIEEDSLCACPVALVDGRCPENPKALFFGDLLNPDEGILVRYEGDTGVEEENL